MEELVPGGRVGREAFQAFLGYLYTGKLWAAPLDVVSCADPVCPHDSCPPAIRFAVEIMYAAWTFKIHELISAFQLMYIRSIAVGQLCYFDLWNANG
ncbi:regulatory protein NPR3-like [Panicum miliaceum]|uniref:Regulatory protein NPR3-like n=1 Tax=Panicum miliaceum TaxID=4540 RepID=A0A3L6RUG5_PANMI|nr:regulatory protein NPR3-like [Panicum miliaceum]